MPRIDKGSYEDYGDFAIQPDRTIIEKNDGTLEGNVSFKADKNLLFKLPDIGDSHPDDSKLECYNRTLSYGTNNLVTAVCSYFGLESSPTDPVVSYTGGQNNDPIETHPDFESTLAGAATAALNGAAFVTDTAADDYGLFLGFQEDTTDQEHGQQFRGVEYYLTPSTTVTLSYWTEKVPALKNRLKIYNTIPRVNSREFKAPPDVTNWLLLDTPYRQVGSFYQVTEQYLGSGVDGGWNNLIYEQA